MKTCSRCKSTKLLKEFYKSKQSADGYQYHCKQCDLKLKQLYIKKNNENYKVKKANQKLKSRYGVTLEEYNVLLEKQNHKCAICNMDQSKFKRRFHLDHDHKTNKIRALLCQPCNMALGFVKDDISIAKKIISYLKEHSNG